MHNDSNQELYELWLIGAILAGAPFHEILLQIDTEDFTYSHYKNIYLQLCGLYSQAIPLNIANCVANGIDMSPLLEMKTEIANMKDWQLYINKIKEETTNKKLRQILSSGLEKLKQAEDIEQIKAWLTLELKLLQQDIALPNFAKDIDGWLDNANDNTEFKQIIFSGISSLNRHLAPLRGARLIFMAARPGQGKTALAAQIALETASMGNGVAFFSLENCKPQLSEVLLASAFQVNRSKLAVNDLSELNNFTKLAAFNKFRELGLYVFDDKFKLNEVCAMTTYLVKANKINLAIIDYIGLIENKRNKNDSTNDYLGDISRRLKVLTMSLKIPVIVLCQLNRSSEKEHREPTLADLRSCGNFEQDGDFVLMVHRNKSTEYRLKQTGKLLPHLFETRLLVEKSRVGPVALVDDFIFNGQTQRFTEKDLFFNTEIVESKTGS